jgi:hypothetical protein
MYSMPYGQKIVNLPIIVIKKAVRLPGSFPVAFGREADSLYINNFSLFNCVHRFGVPGSSIRLPHRSPYTPLLSMPGYPFFFFIMLSTGRAYFP